MNRKYALAFYNHKNNAKRRNIEFHFTYEEWIAWWEKQLGPNWFEMRGHCRGQYVMARKKDKGVYIKGNVKCIKHEENSKEQVANGTSGRGLNYSPHRIKHVNKLTTENVKAIFYKDDLQKNLAKKYGVSERMVRLIKNKQVWRSITSSL